ncbi:Hpt domain-containing protein [uncultured Parabacteroides sp.]|uniref:Hpt domain-containing protein n=1 Tax=uncultured Parabacteroides sp. TaxID=512312 RepID=UPI002587A1EF|nr:Hpt domain-containing protein [uncultured Parabacteroides sp.]
MTDKYKRQLLDAGVNLESALDRFMGSEVLYDNFLLKFIQDNTFCQLKEFLSNNDIQNAFVQAHTLKGVVANLEFLPLLDILTPMTELLRSGDIEKISEQQELLEVRYDKICSIIKDNH